MENATNFINFKRDIQTLNYAELNYLISDIMLEIKKRSFNEGMVKGMTSFGAPVESAKSPQQIRDEIVEKSKRDIDELKRPGKAQHGGWWDYREKLDGEHPEYGKGSGQAWRSEFIVNKEKRTVVVLLRNYIDGTYVSRRGIAKCDPSDCFNVHIGKAIALRRALGLEVPSEYLNAPQPTEVRMGDVVKSLVSGTTGTALESEEGKYTLNQNGVYYTLAHSACNVVDDSREGSEGNGEEI